MRDFFSDDRDIDKAIDSIGFDPREKMLQVATYMKKDLKLNDSDMFAVVASLLDLLIVYSSPNRKTAYSILNATVNAGKLFVDKYYDNHGERQT